MGGGGGVAAECSGSLHLDRRVCRGDAAPTMHGPSSDEHSDEPGGLPQGLGKCSFHGALVVCLLLGFQSCHLDHPVLTPTVDGVFCKAPAGRGQRYSQRVSRGLGSGFRVCALGFFDRKFRLRGRLNHAQCLQHVWLQSASECNIASLCNSIAGAGQ